MVKKMINTNTPKRDVSFVTVYKQLLTIGNLFNPLQLPVLFKLMRKIKWQLIIYFYHKSVQYLNYK